MVVESVDAEMRSVDTAFGHNRCGKVAVVRVESGEARFFVSLADVEADVLWAV